jgi:hypothetical protein
MGANCRDPNPTWMGYSVGHWEGDTLVVETAGFNDKTWLDMVGHPHSDHLRVTEKFRRADFGHMQVQVTYDDPETLTRPLTMSVAVNYAADADMLEYVCNEDERDTEHLVGTAKAATHPSPAVLARYAGEYKFRDGVVTSRDFFGPDQIVSVLQGQLYMKERDQFRFDRRDDRVLPGFERPGDALYSHAAEGDARYDRTR